MKSFFILLVLALAPSALLADIEPIRLQPTRPAAPATVTAPAATPAKPSAQAKAKKHAKKHAKKKQKAQ